MRVILISFHLLGLRLFKESNNQDPGGKVGFHINWKSLDISV